MKEGQLAHHFVTSLGVMIYDHLMALFALLMCTLCPQGLRGNIGVLGKQQKCSAVI